MQKPMPTRWPSLHPYVTSLSRYAPKRPRRADQSGMGRDIQATGIRVPLSGPCVAPRRDRLAGDGSVNPYPASRVSGLPAI